MRLACWVVTLSLYGCESVVGLPEILKPQAPATVDPSVPAIASPPVVECTDLKQAFERRVWGAFMAKDCAGCHAPDGNAVIERARFVLQRETAPAFVEANIEALQEMTKLQVDGVSLLLAKAQGQLNHGGGQVLDPQGPQYRALSDFLTLAQSPMPRCDRPATKVLDSVPLLSPAQTLRKAYIGLAGQVPPADLLARVTDEASLNEALNAVFDTAGFDSWLRDRWNDQLLVRRGLITAFPGVYEMWSGDFPRATYYHSVNLPNGASSEEYWSANNSVVEQPLRLISYIVKEDRPFSEVLTARYTVLNPALMDLFGVSGGPRVGYGNLDQWRRVDRLTFKPGTPEQFDAPLAGILTTPGFLGRFSTTTTNRSRARARVVYKLFLGVDLFTLSKREVDTSSLRSIINPEANTAACSVCHQVMDPVAGIFRGFYEDADGSISFSFNPERAWHPEMKAPGLNGQVMPANDYSAAAQWGAKAIVNDPRFALAIAKSAFTAVTGSPVLAYPTDAESPTFDRDLAAWNTQDDYLQALAQRFAQANFSYRFLLRTIITGPFYRAVGSTQNSRLDELMGFGRPLAPEQLSAKLAATTGARYSIGWYTHTSRGVVPYDYLTDLYQLQGGGIDSLYVEHRSNEIGALRAALLDRMASYVSCRATAFDFTKEPSMRKLFPSVQVGQAPVKRVSGQWQRDAAGEAAVRKGLVHLHYQLLGESLAEDSARIDETLSLFEGAYRDVAEAASPALPCTAYYDVSAPAYDAMGALAPYSHPLLPTSRQITADPTFTIRAWQAVVWFLLSEPAFVME